VVSQKKSEGGGGMLLLTLLARQVWRSLLEVKPDLRMFHLRVVDINIRLFVLELLDNGDRSRLASITSVCLERKPKYGDPLRQHPISHSNKVR
jgi:hypothetical protein